MRTQSQTTFINITKRLPFELSCIIWEIVLCSSFDLREIIQNLGKSFQQDVIISDLVFKSELRLYSSINNECCLSFKHIQGFMYEDEDTILKLVKYMHEHNKSFKRIHFDRKYLDFLTSRLREMNSKCALHSNFFIRRTAFVSDFFEFYLENCHESSFYQLPFGTLLPLVIPKQLICLEQVEELCISLCDHADNKARCAEFLEAVMKEQKHLRKLVLQLRFGEIPNTGLNELCHFVRTYSDSHSSPNIDIIVTERETFFQIRGVQPTLAEDITDPFLSDLTFEVWNMVIEATLYVKQETTDLGWLKNLPNLKKLSLKSILTEDLRFPIFLESDSLKTLDLQYVLKKAELNISGLTNLESAYFRCCDFSSKKTLESLSAFVQKLSFYICNFQCPVELPSHLQTLIVNSQDLVFPTIRNLNSLGELSYLDLTYQGGENFKCAESEQSFSELLRRLPTNLKSLTMHDYYQRTVSSWRRLNETPQRAIMKTDNLEYEWIDVSNGEDFETIGIPINTIKSSLFNLALNCWRISAAPNSLKDVMREYQARQRLSIVHL